MLQSLLLSNPFFRWHLPGLLLLALCGRAVPLRSQDLSQLAHFSTADGLPANQILNVETDSEGFIWVLTRQGPARYDGRRFVPLTALHPGIQLPQQGFSYMLIDGRDQMWIGAATGMYRISLATFDVALFEKNLQPYCTDSERNVWFTSGKNMVRYGWQQDAFREYPLLVHGDTIAVNLICRGKDNHIVARGAGRLYRFDPRKEVFEPLHGLPEALVHAVFVAATDSEGLLWLSLWYRKTDGLLHYDPYRDTILRRFGSATHPVSTDINAMLPDGDQVWFATNSDGLHRFSLSENRFKGYPANDKNPGGLWPTQLTNVFKDVSGNLWVGTLFGLYMAPASRQTTQLLAYSPFDPNSLVSRPATSLEFISDTILAIGTMNGISLYDRYRKTFRNIHLPLYNDNPYNDQIRAFARDAPGSFWVASWSGLYRLDDRNGRILEYCITHPNAGENHPAPVKKMQMGAIYRLFKDREGVLWASTFAAGLHRISGSATARRFENLNERRDYTKLLSKRVECLLDLDERYLLLGNADGLLRFDRATQRFEPVKVAFPGLEPPVAVASMVKSRQGDLLLIAKNMPFRLRLNGTNGMATPIPSPLNLMPCQQIIEDNTGTVWVTQEDGVVQLDAGKNIGRLYDSRHFLLGNVFAVRPPFPPAKDSDGVLYFGGAQGVTVLNPHHFSRQHTALPILKITGLKVNGAVFVPDSSISRLQTLDLSWKQANLGFEFSVLNAVVPALCRFSYSLDDNHPVDLGTQNTLNLSNLAPGTHLLHVTATNSDGVRDKQGVTLRIVVHPPWWRSIWAYLAYALLLAYSIFRLYRFQLRQKLAQQEALQLREMDAFKSRFFTNITHEFRTPLTVILGMTERLAADGARVSENIAKSSLDMIKRNGENLLRLINQILDLSKLENNALKINYVQGDVVAYLRYITESLQSLANAQNLTLHVDSEQESITMDYDPERLQQIVHNLLSNAIKFTPAGGRVVLRVASAGLKTLPTLVITVSDTGVGIAAHELPNLFDRFFQAGNHEQVKAGGSGIGLSLTRELVRAMGGTISVESIVGKGTAVTVRLPITNNGPTPDLPTKVRDRLSPTGRGGVEAHFPMKLADPTEYATSPLPMGEGSGEGPDLLIIEDNADVMAYLVACLQGEYKIVCAYNGREGIEKAVETVPDLILSDVMMPEKDGLEVCDALKNDERTSHIPIVLLTAKADVESRIAGLRRGADAYLSKPFHKEELRLTLANLMEQRRKWQERFSTLGLVSGTSAPLAPELPKADVELEDAFLKKIREHLEQHLADADFDGPRLARAMLLSEVQLYRKIKALTGKSTAIYIRSIRLHKGLELLRSTSLTVSEIAYDVGFDDPNYFSRTFSQEFGVAPSEVRK